MYPELWNLGICMNPGGALFVYVFVVLMRLPRTEATRSPISSYIIYYDMLSDHFILYYVIACHICVIIYSI